MKKFLFFLIAVLALGTMKQNIYAQEKKLRGLDFGLQVTSLAEIGVFTSYRPIYFGVGFNFWQPNDFEGDPYWNDVTMRLGYSYKFKIGIGFLAGLQGRVLFVRSNWGLTETDIHFIFMPEVGVSYTWKRLYGNVAFQLDTNNIKNSTYCFVIGGTL
jgi:hypothetical protein